MKDFLLYVIAFLIFSVFIAITILLVYLTAKLCGFLFFYLGFPTPLITFIAADIWVLYGFVIAFIWDKFSEEK